MSRSVLGTLWAIVLGSLFSTVSAQAAVWRLNCAGSSPEPAPFGPDFVADSPYAPGGAGYVGGTVKGVGYVGGLWSDLVDVHRTTRIGWSAYRFDVPNGDYLLRLHFAEIDEHGAGMRVFDLNVEGSPWLVDFDVYTELGKDYAGAWSTAVNVSDGRLDVTASGDPAILSAIEVWTAPATAPGPAPVLGLTAKASYGRNILAWEPALSGGVVGFRVYASPNVGGPFTPLVDTQCLPPRFLDETAPVGVNRFYRVTALDYLGQESALSAVVSARARASAASPLPVYEIQIAAADWEHLNGVFETDKTETVPATLLFNGESYPCEARYRGQSSLFHPKKSWKLKFPEDGLFLGRKQLNLKAHFGDESLLRQEVAMEVFRRAGHETPDSSFGHLRINGEYVGVYQYLEKINSDWLRARDRDNDGNIYSADLNDAVELGLMEPLKMQKSFLKETNEESSYDDLAAFLDVINLTPDADFALAIARELDLEGYLDYIAANGVLVDFEAVVRNYHLLHDFELDRWEIVAWDNDASFSYPYSSIDFGTDGHWMGDNRLKSRVLANPGLRWRYAEKLRELLAGPYLPATMDALVDDRFQSIGFEARADVLKDGWEDDSLFLFGPTDLATKVQFRRETLLAEIDDFQATAVAPVLWINEFMADNATTAFDEVGEAEDWVELYNPSAAALDVGGMHLTDELDVPTRWTIPAGTTIPAGGHLLIWADEEPADGPLHASFKLGSGGEELGLFAANGTTLIDAVHFGPQVQDVSRGRTHDGGAFLRPLGTPTPGAPNTDLGNVPPRVTWVKHEPSTPLSSEPLRVSCMAKDTDDLTSVDLVWGLAGGVLSTVAMTGGNHWYSAEVPPQPNGSVIEYYLEVTDDLGGVTRVPAGAPGDVFQVAVVDPQVADLRINEILADNDSTLADEAGDFDDWIEIHNASPITVNLSGMFLTDDLTNPDKWAFPAGTLLEPGGELLVWADDEPSEGPLHASFSLSKSGEAVGLFGAESTGNQMIDSFVFNAQEEDVSVGHMPDGGDLWVRLFDPTPGEPNQPLAGGVVAYDVLDADLHSLAMDTPFSAQLGQLFQLSVVGALPNSFGATLVGVEGLGFLLPPDGALLVLPLGDFSIPLPFNAGGTAVASLDVPALPGLVGVSVFLQSWASGGVGLSNAVVATIGP